MPHIIPAVLYKGALGTKNYGGFVVPEAYQDLEAWSAIQEKLTLLHAHSISVTAEMTDVSVTVAFNDGEMDYRSQPFPNDKDLSSEIVDLVLSFDEADYLAAKQAFIDAGGA